MSLYTLVYENLRTGFGFLYLLLGFPMANIKMWLLSFNHCMEKFIIVHKNYRHSIIPILTNYCTQFYPLIFLNGNTLLMLLFFLFYTKLSSSAYNEDFTN